ncbi:hypothetical protein B0H11DRAFT_595873 [Mycena galericulata]|nr:hypothetical protein B0H11DRAFT_595873 [Mycena galericulata]
MGGALPLIGTVSAGAIGGAAGAVGGAVASHARGTNGTDVAAGSDAGGPGGGGQPDEKDNLGDDEGTQTAMFNYKSLLTITLVALTFVALTSPAPTPTGFQNRGTDESASVEVCTGPVPTGCVTVPVVPDDCVDLTGGLSFLNGEISGAVVPDGFVCTFFDDFGCISEGTGNSGTDSEVVLQGGTYDFSDLLACLITRFTISQGIEIWE